MEILSWGPVNLTTQTTHLVCMASLTNRHDGASFAKAAGLVYTSDARRGPGSIAAADPGGSDTSTPAAGRSGLETASTVFARS